MTNPQLRRLTETWRELLGLNGWVINARFTNDASEIHDSGVADIEVSEGTREASIKLLRFRYRKNDGLLIITKDYEVDLVHELLHIWVEQFRNPKLTERGSTTMEQFIESLARLLVALRRAGLPDKKLPVVHEPAAV